MVGRSFVEPGAGHPHLLLLAARGLPGYRPDAPDDPSASPALLARTRSA
jgi:hypothetical protein